MARTIVNKHFDDKNKVTREQFHENSIYAKGEIIIVNDEEPSIYVLNNNDEPTQISGGKGGITEEQLNVIISGYTEEDKKIREEIKAADDELRGLINGVNDDFMDVVDAKIDTITKKYQNADYTNRQELENADKAILAHTVNGYTIESDPELSTSDLGMGAYGNVVFDTTEKEYITNSDTAQKAIKKLENMFIASSVAFSAALNNLNARISELEEEIKNIKEGNIE